MLRPFLLGLLCLVLASCGTIKEGGSQEITVETPGANDAVCYLDNQHMKYRLFTPGAVVVARRPGALTVTCLADGNRTKTVVFNEELNKDAVYGNIVTAGIGSAWDYQTGGLFDYPERIVVDFTDIPPQRMALPNYEQHIRKNPDLYGMEEFRPGNAILMGDRYRESHQLKRKDAVDGDMSASGLSGFTTSDGTADISVVIGSDGGSASSSTASGIAVAPAATSSSSSSSSSPGSGSASSTADSLTRSMNPNVFPPSGFAGGVSSGSDAPPMRLHPAQ